MANFVEFKQGEAIRSINLDNVDLISLFLCDVGKSDISIAFNSDGVPLNIDFETQEEAQALYDLLRGKKEPKDTIASPNNIAKEVHKILELGWTNTMKLSPEDTKQFTEFWKKVDIQISNIMQVIKKEEAQAQALYDLLRGKNEESNLPKGSSGQILDGIGKWRDPTPEEIKEQEKILASNLDDDDYAAQLQKALNQLREKDSKKESSIKDPDLIPITIGCGKFIEAPQEMDINYVMDFYYQHVKPLWEKLDRIRDVVKMLDNHEESLFGIIYKDAEKARQDQQFISNKYRSTIEQINAILAEGEG